MYADSSESTPQPAVVTRCESASIEIERTADDLYYYWRTLSNLPRFMKTLESIEEHGIGISRWRRRLPSGAVVTWEAELTCDYPGSRISWRSIQGALTSEAGSVRFINAPTRGVTEVHVTLEYEATLSADARCVARLFRSEPGAELADDLRMLKHSLEQSATHNAMLPEEHAFATVSHAG